MTAFCDDSCPLRRGNSVEPLATVLRLAPDNALPSSTRVCGTGGWMQPENREALDWLTPARFLGWEVNVCAANRGGRFVAAVSPTAVT